MKLMRALRFSVLGAIALTALIHAAPTAAVADAAMQGNRDAVRVLLKQAADVNAAQGDGMTALHWAAMKNDADLVQTLLFAGANVRATTRIGSYTPLILAAKSGSGSVIAPLLKSGADANSATSNGTTALMLAAASGNADAVTLLIDGGAKVNEHEPVRGLTAAMFAAASNRAAVLTLLAKHGADLKATSKVTDLAALSKDPAALREITFGNPPPPGEPPAGGRNGPVPQAPAAGGPGGRGGRGNQVAGVDRNYQLNELVAAQGGLTPLLLAAREGHSDAVQALLGAGADVNQPSAGDQTTPLLIATINGHFDLAKLLLERGAAANAASENNATALYAALNCEWAPKALYPQPRAQMNQKTTYLELMKVLLNKGADPNVRLNKKVWYSGYSFDLSGVDETGATPFWRAAYASDVDAMKMLVSYGADPNIRTKRIAGRPRAGDIERDVVDVSGLPPVPVGGPGVTPLQAAAGVGYGEGFAANSHRFAPGGMLAAVKYLVEELHVDVNAPDHEGNTALHHAAARGDVEMIQYLVSKGADVKAITREGRTTADMANGPVQRIQPYPEALALLEKLGAKNNHKCVSC
ncbi:MAG TPA: ankyrin repeat domain-containing protein [Vicinamibacterales bacterium]|nr:ankyrin repeat domain-containing protein [Vicinamibacterales bacterium]